jgi:hypothetical protein
MTARILFSLAIAAVLVIPFAQADEVRFRAVDICIDSGDTPLAAWQVEVKAISGDADVVGIEGGEHPAFREPAHFDPRALQGGRIVLAAFSTSGDLPTGGGRIASLHVQETGPAAEYELKLIVAAGGDGSKIPVRAFLLPADGGRTCSEAPR